MKRLCFPTNETTNNSQQEQTEPWIQPGGVLVHTRSTRQSSCAHRTSENKRKHTNRRPQSVCVKEYIYTFTCKRIPAQPPEASPLLQSDLKANVAQGVSLSVQCTLTEYNFIVGVFSESLVYVSVTPWMCLVIKAWVNVLHIWSGLDVCSDLLTWSDCLDRSFANFSMPAHRQRYKICRRNINFENI